MELRDVCCALKTCKLVAYVVGPRKNGRACLPLACSLFLAPPTSKRLLRRLANRRYYLIYFIVFFSGGDEQMEIQA